MDDALFVNISLVEPDKEIIRNFEEGDDCPRNLKIRGIANFLGILKANKLVAQIPPGADVNIDLSETRLVGITYMDFLVEFLKKIIFISKMHKKSTIQIFFSVGFYFVFFAVFAIISC